MSPMPAIPRMTVKKMSGAMSILMALMKATPKGCISVPKAGYQWPTATPVTIASRT
jgi:hypothetical protein